MSEEKKAFGLCVLAFLLGSLIVMSMGCSAGARVRVDEGGAGAGVRVEHASDCDGCTLCVHNDNQDGTPWHPRMQHGADWRDVYPDGWPPK